jgi:hypothetical protein
MKIEHLEERITDYKKSVQAVVDKRIYWKEHLKSLLDKTLNSVVKRYDLGWNVQHLKWLHSDEAVNIVFESFPPELVDCTNLIPAYQFTAGGALVFSQGYNGDVTITILYPDIHHIPTDENMTEIGTYLPQEITEKLILEKVDEFLKEIIKWEVPSLHKKLGY